MSRPVKRLTNWLRVLALAGIAAIGLVAIVGSGGGSLGFPPCDTWWCNTTPPPQLPTVSLEPARVTALVGTSVTFRATPSNVTGNVAYQWFRSSDAGQTFVEISGATGSSYTLANVNLADDGAAIRVRVVASNGTVFVTSHLLVSTTPGIAYADGEFQSADWLTSAVVDSTHPAFTYTQERVTDGGNPGAFRRMTYTLPSGAGLVIVFYSAQAAVYEPATQGAIRVIDYAEDCAEMQASSTTFTTSSLLIEQGGRRYVFDADSNACTSTAWGSVASRSSLTPQDFRVFDGPDCALGQTCLDFSASAPPLRFGYRRIAWGVPGDVIAHGIDNWKVTVWRR